MRYIPYIIVIEFVSQGGDIIFQRVNVFLKFLQIPSVPVTFNEIPVFILIGRTPETLLYIFPFIHVILIYSGITFEFARLHPHIHKELDLPVEITAR